MKLHSDIPISKYDDDIFDRKPIADKLATFIQYRSENKENDSFCIGVYGKWGEGKTSLVNMTIDKLKENKSDNIVISQYNPWLLKDQESILYDFFNTISDDDLGKKTIKFLKEYGAIVSLGLEGVLGLTGIPLAGKATSFSLNKIVKALPNSNQSVSELKKKVNKSLRESGKHLVVFVDDLDRLDREEIHAVLKLIRQNTDFENTTYILMMDYEVVSSSLQTKYSDANKNSGQEFLAKIVQFPLYLPQIQEYHLERFLFSKLDTLLSSLDNNDKIYNDAIEKAKSDIRNFVLPLFSTPREIIQYINILSFVVPTMYKELNLSDLCLLEALKKFSYECYKEIRDNKYVLLDISNTESQVLEYIANKNKSSKEVEDDKREIVKNIYKIQSNKHIASIIEYLLDDFVQSRQRNEIFYNNRLCNIIFFDKYFIYDTPVDILSEKFIDDIGYAIENNEEENLIELFNKIQ
ncbi:MAG: P-loop NTPase fold protein, partial [Bacteroidales bacterium]